MGAPETLLSRVSTLHPDGVWMVHPVWPATYQPHTFGCSAMRRALNGRRRRRWPVPGAT